MKHDNHIFETMAVPKAILKNIIPSIITMVVILIYNIADTFFVGQTGDPMQVAAVSLATPVFLLFMAFGNLIGIGGMSVISRAFGAGNNKHAKHVSSFCFWISLGSGVVFTLLFWALMPFILKIIGTSKETIGYAREYLMYIAPSAPFVIISIAFSNIVRAEGKATDAMVGTLIGTVINIILDPVFIIGLNMGVKGAAIATLIGNAAGALYYLIFFFRAKTRLSISPRYFRMGDKILTGVIAIGIPAALNNVLMSLVNIIMNNLLARYGDIQVAAMGVAIKVSLIVVLLQIGLGAGIQPLLGFSYGAQNRERFREVMKTSLLYTVGLGVVLSAASWFGAKMIVRGFIDDDAVFGYAVVFVKILLLSGPVIGILFVFTNALQAMGAAMESLILSLSRQGIVFIPLLFILDSAFGLSGIVYAQPAADFVSIAVAGVLYYLKVKKPFPAMFKQNGEEPQELRVFDEKVLQE